MGVAVALCVNGAVFAQDASAPQSSPDYCPLGVRVDSIPGHDDEALFSLWADDRAARATGMLVAYAGNQRYRIPFDGAVAADNRNPRILPTPIVVRFATATRVDSAYVAALEGAGCGIHDPFVRSGLQGEGQADGTGYGPLFPSWSQAWKIFLELAAHAPVLPPPDAEIVDAPACAQPYVNAYAARSATAIAPTREPSFSGEIVLRLAIDADGSLLGLRVERSSRLPAYDAAAVDAAVRTRFASQVYRCAPVIGAYRFPVDFSQAPGTLIIRSTSSP